MTYALGVVSGVTLATFSFALLLFAVGVKSERKRRADSIKRAVAMSYRVQSLFRASQEAGEPIVQVRADTDWEAWTKLTEREHER